MDLTQRVAFCASGNTVRIDRLELDRRCQILRAEKIISCSGAMVLLTVRENVDNFIQAYLPTKYREAFVLRDVTDINTKVVMYNLIFTGLCNCSGSQSAVLAIDILTYIYPSDFSTLHVCL
jgi:hypothetical protein